MALADTIVAIATPPGRGGLGVVRLSGPAAFAIARQLLGGIEPEARRARRAQFHDPASGDVLDQVIALGFAGPHSYTGEDVVEVSGHGSPVLLGAVLDAARAAGARLAEPGEFSRRAFLNGRMDLSQAEAVRDLIASHTLFQARTAARQLQGSVAAMLRPAREQLIELIARLEAGIDFAEDDVTTLPVTVITAELDRLTPELERLAASFQRGRLIREGLTLAIVGRPNVGKSSLFNRLLVSDRAIVTAEPGTTRDVIAESLDWDGIPVRLLDTAGLRTAESQAEQLGIARSRQALADADLVLAVFDLSQPLADDDRALLASVRDLPQALIVGNKSDCPTLADLPQADVRLSAATGAGLDRLRAVVRSRIHADSESGEVITNVRHHQHLYTALTHVQAARTAVAAGWSHEAVLVDLYEALHQLDAIGGQTTVEDILGVIFSTFCIGK